MSEKTKDVWVRALKTVWQAALGYLLADAALLQRALTIPLEWSLWATLLAGAAAAGFSAICNGLVKPALEAKIPYFETEVRRISLMCSERIDGVLTYTEIYGKNLTD